ncbi:MAG TPA: CRTAC1 family protein [Thermoanaerobaculia bacterium]
MRAAPPRRRLARLAPIPLILSAAVLGPAGAAPPAPSHSTPIFVERARESGLDFVHRNGMTGRLYMPEIMGPGAALVDIDNDGDLDVFLVQGGPLSAETAGPRPPGAGHRLFRNDSKPGRDGRLELRFTDVTAASGITAGCYGMGVAAGDYDNDGWPDLYVTGLGCAQLWHNNGPDAKGQITFTDVTAKSGTANPHWGVAATFFDYDRDGRLDLYVGNYLSFSWSAKPCRTPAGEPDYCGPVSADAVPGRLFHNRGDGTFEDVTAKSGIGAEYGPALGAIAVDLDGDGWPDLYVANDETPNQLWINQRNGTFKNVALAAGCAVGADGRPQASMGVDAGDYDGDGREDLFMDNLTGEGDALYRNVGSAGNGGKAGDALFEDATIASRLALPSRPLTGFGAAFLDYDNDGRLDLLTVNGAIKRIESQRRAGDPLPLKQPRQLLRNVGGGRFEEVTAEAGPAFGAPAVGRGAAFGDLDNDGATDVVVADNDGPVRLFVNQVGRRNHFLGLRLMTGKRDALGARVELARAGQPVLVRHAHADGSYASANDPRVLFGLGESAAKGDVTVTWPDGRREVFKGLRADAYTTLHQGSGTAVP